MRSRFPLISRVPTAAFALFAIAMIGSASFDCSDPAPAANDNGDDDDDDDTSDAGVIDAGKKDSGKKPTKDAGPAPVDVGVDANDPWENPTRDGWTLVWQDEFTGASGGAVDTSKWSFDIGGGGWGNAEAEYYTDRTQNAHLDGNGNLTIRAFNEAYKGSTYTSARLVTQNTFSQIHGRFEVRARLPVGQGIWPAFWLLGTDTGDGWPACGEIDVMEYIGSEPTQIRGSLHGPGYSGPTALVKVYQLPAGSTFADGLHVFAVEWEQGTIRYFVDSELYATQSTASIPSGGNWVFDDHPFFIILNLAIGGILPGSPDDSTQFPTDLTVDYVRVYKR